MSHNKGTGINTRKSLYVALWNYHPVEEDELPLSKGDMVCASVDYLENSFGEWMIGENTRGKVGKFPATYVKAVDASSAASAPLAMNTNFDPDAKITGINGAHLLMTKADKSLRQYLKDNRAFHFHDALVELGVEHIRDLKLVLPSDLFQIGMDEATIKRVLSVTNGSRIVSSLSPDEMNMLKEYLAECAPDNGPADDGGTSTNPEEKRQRADLSVDQQTLLMTYVVFQFEALAQFRHLHALFSRAFYVKTNPNAVEKDLVAEAAETERVPEDTEAKQNFAARFAAAISQRRRSLGNTRVLRPDMMQDSSCKFCRRLKKEVLTQLLQSQEKLCEWLSLHALEEGCGDKVMRYVKETTKLFKAYADLQPRVQREIRQFIARLEAKVGPAATAIAQALNQKRRDRIIPLCQALHAIQKLLGFPLRKLKEDTTLLTRVSVLRSDTGPEGQVFREIVRMYQPGQPAGVAANALATAAATSSGRRSSVAQI